MKRLTITLLTLLLLGGCTITTVDNDRFWSDKYYQLQGNQINDVIENIGPPAENLKIEESDLYTFETFYEDYLGRTSICKLQLKVEKGIVTQVQIIGSEGSCSRFRLK